MEGPSENVEFTFYIVGVLGQKNMETDKTKQTKYLER